jgi:hypothetical protein
LQQSGDVELLQHHLNVIREQARSGTGFFKQNNREWIFRARDLSRDLQRDAVT